MLPKTIYYVTTIQFYVNIIENKFKVGSLQMLERKSLLTLISLIEEFETTPFKHFVVVNILLL